jgi:aryl-alcohol dehydrogenase-like predicted oxidoreductase
MLTRRLGRTGHHSSVAVLGGAAFWDADPDTTAAGFGAALDAGVNHLDVAPQYGRAQELLGPLVGPARDRLFVACKTLRHDPAGVRAQLEESLTLLGCEHFDLYQLHAVTDLAELDARARAISAILAARDEGLCRFVGVTGHNLTTPVAQLEAHTHATADAIIDGVIERGRADFVTDVSSKIPLAVIAELLGARLVPQDRRARLFRLPLSRTRQSTHCRALSNYP